MLLRKLRLASVLDRQGKFISELKKILFESIVLKKPGSNCLNIGAFSISFLLYIICLS